MPAQSEGNIIEAPQNITGSWADLGSEIESIDYSFFSAYLVIDINDSQNVMFRFRALYESGGNDFIIPIQNIKKDKIELIDFHHLVSDIDQNIILQTEMDQNIKFLKIQVKADTAGATPGIITSAKYRQGYRQ